jgi:2,4-dienoyl-CoA reductase-like NADH-dependent reductase (Old Yellow Enzyme family)
MKLQDPFVIRGNTIKNRIVMEPMVTFSFHGDNGSFYGSQHLEHYTARAKGGAGLIILQATAVFGAADAAEKWSAENTKVLRRIAENCHEYGATVMMQLACGNVEINSLTLPDIHKLQRDMVQAAVTACRLGFDGAEFHFAHGYTLCKFLDAAYNRRTDAYGGSAERRAAIFTEILPEIREKTGEHFILGVRMGEYQPESSDGVAAAKVFERAGIDLLNISFGMKLPAGPVPQGFPCSAMTWSGCKVRKEVHIPVIVVNEIRTAEQAHYLVEQDYADLVGIGRAMLTDPDFAGHVLNGEPVNSCHGCRNCRWFTDHTRCPGIKALAGKRQPRGRERYRVRERRNSHASE